MNKVQFYITFFLLLSILFLTGCDDNEPIVDVEPTLVIDDLIPNHEGTVYEINFFEMNNAADFAAINSFVEQTESALTMFSGRRMVDLLKLTSSLIQNDALPSVVRNFETDYVIINAFPDEEAFQRYQNEESFKGAYAELEPKITEHVQLLNVLAPSPPGAPVGPELGVIPPRPAPAFYLMNFLTIPPDTTSINSFNTYLGLNTPRVLGSETVFSQPFFPALVLKGEFQMPVAFISFAEFKDDAAFDFVHNETDAVENIFPFRNNVLVDFVEARLEVAQ